MEKCTCKNSLEYENCNKICERLEAEESDLYAQIKSLFSPYMSEDLADLKTTEVIKITGVKVF